MRFLADSKGNGVRANDRLGSVFAMIPPARSGFLRLKSVPSGAIWRELLCLPGHGVSGVVLLLLWVWCLFPMAWAADPRVFSEPPPLARWAGDGIVDEPESAYHSIGRTLWHFGRNPALIAKFHGWLEQRQIPPRSLLRGTPGPPAEMHRILIEPERLTVCEWKAQGDWIVSRGGHRGPTARLSLTIDRKGMYRCWIRYWGHAKGTAVTHLTIYRKGREQGVPLLYEEFNGEISPQDGPRWHDFVTDLEAGDYTVALGHVIRYYHAPDNVPFLEHKVDCLYLTDELWAPAPAAEVLAAMRGQSDAVQCTSRPVLDAAQRDQWTLWQVRPVDWESAAANEPLFRQSYAFWREEMQALAGMDYRAAPTDAVRKGIADYRDPRRQVVFDPVWNMVGNPHRIHKQIGVLEADIDPAAKDAVFTTLYPGRFPLVQGQWIREGGGLSADHGAVSALALGSHEVPHPGRWHLWVQFKNINYFEYFALRTETVFGQRTKWERTERLYPGGRSAWAKVAAIDLPHQTPAEVQAHQALAAKGVFVADGEPRLVIPQGDWKSHAGAFSGGENSTLWAGTALRVEGDFQVSARLTLAELPAAGTGFVFMEEHGLQENLVGFDGSLSGPSLSVAKEARLAAAVRANEPFDLEIRRRANVLTVSFNGAEAGAIALKSPPSGKFGFRVGKNVLRVHGFAATGALDDGLALRRRINIALGFDKYINPRTYRGVYKLLITDDEDYQPEGGLAPKINPARYTAQLRASGMVTDAGYVLNVSPGIGVISQGWMPGPDKTNATLELAMARDTTQSASLRFRNAGTEPLVLRIEPGPLVGRAGSHAGSIRWRAVAFAPYGEGREEWTPFFLLRRPFQMVPPRGAAQAWLTFDSSGLPAGDYTGTVRISASDLSGRKTYPEREVLVKLRVADTRVEPKTPILLHGWTQPPPGDENLRDWFLRFNVWQGPFFAKEQMRSNGIQLQVRPQWDANPKQIRAAIDEARKLGLEAADWAFSIADEPTGVTVAALQKYLTIAKLIREADPGVRITMNPGEAARAATFAILQPYVDLWNPYKLHLSYGPSGRDYLKKPWIWYTTPCYQDKSPGIAGEMYEQIRSVLRQPGDCRGTALFAPYYPWRDPWDTAYEHIKDVSVFVLPSRHGPVATPAWEAIREAVQHANLARMVRERAQPGDARAKAIWESGSVPEILDWLK